MTFPPVSGRWPPGKGLELMLNHDPTRRPIPDWLRPYGSTGSAMYGDAAQPSAGLKRVESTDLPA